MHEADAPLAALADLINRECQAGVIPAPDGSLHLRMADDTPIAVSQSPDGRDIIFHSTLAVMDRPRDAVLMMAALALNLHQEQTGGGAVGLDLDSLSLVYSLRVGGGGTDAPALALLLEEFCSRAQHLRRELATAGQSMAGREKSLFMQHIEDDLASASASAGWQEASA